jgi:aminopeptidase N
VGRQPDLDLAGAVSRTSSTEVARPGADRSDDSYLPKHGNGGYRVNHYDLECDYRIASNRLDGRAVLSATAEHALSRFSLDLIGPRATAVIVDGRPARFEQVAGKVRIRPQSPIPAGAGFRIDVRYSGRLRPVSGPWGDIGWDELTDGVIVASQPTGAPSWFPCNDHPSDKASYRVALTTAPAYMVVATGNLVSRSRRSGGTRWVYERPEPTSSYLMSVQIGRYVDVDLAGTSIRQRAVLPARLRPKFAVDFGRHNSIMETLQQFFGPYPFGEYVVVVTDDQLDDPVEAQGMSIFGANHVDGLRTHERLVVHELAHQWFGNSLTVADWKHIWLNECFATYAEWLWSDVSGSLDVDLLAAQWHRRLAALPATITLADPGVRNMFDERVYKRGGVMLHALRRQIGDVPFFTLLRGWADEHRHGVVTTEAFVAAAQARASHSLADFFTAWLRRPPLPAISW